MHGSSSFSQKTYQSLRCSGCVPLFRLCSVVQVVSVSLHAFLHESLGIFYHYPLAYTPIKLSRGHGRWISGRHRFIYSCRATLISFEIDCFTVCEHKYMKMHPPPIIDLPNKQSNLHSDKLKTIITNENAGKRCLCYASAKI